MMSLRIMKGDRLTMLKSRFSCLPRPDVIGSSMFTCSSICCEDGPSMYTLKCKRISLLPSLFSSFLDIMKTAHQGARSDRDECHTFVFWDLSRLTMNSIAGKSGADMLLLSLSWVSETEK